MRQNQFIQGASLLMILGFLVPFVLITNFYPFYRFGMFAQPIGEPNQYEQFEIAFQLPPHQTLIPYYAPDYGMNYQNFEYLKRKYFYTDRVDFFLDQLRTTVPKPTGQWVLYKIMAFPDRKDTVAIITTQPHEVTSP
jgi:hypothetical protein